ncbi:MAG: hypothetical protein AAF170_15895 [Bacteroidota bacterium]
MHAYARLARMPRRAVFFYFALGLAVAVALSSCESGLNAPGVAATAQSTEALSLLPSDVQMLGMMDLRAARESDAVQTATGGAGLGMVSPNGSSEFDDFVRRTGFNPGEDLDRVYVAASEARESFAFVAYGRFDRDRITRFIAEQEDADVEPTEIDGLPVYFATEAEGPRAGFALVNDEMILAGDEPSLRAMLDRLGGAASSPSSDVQTLLDRVQYPDGAWFIARDLDMDSQPSGDDPMGAAATMADDMVVSMDFRRDGVAFGAFILPRAGASAEDLERVVKGGVAAARLGMKDEPTAVDVLDRVKVSERNGGVDVEAFLPSAFLASMSD